MWRADSTRKDSGVGKDWRQEKGMTEDEMVGWHHQLNGDEFEQTLEDSEGQGSLGVAKSWTQLSDWTTTMLTGYHLLSPFSRRRNWHIEKEVKEGEFISKVGGEEKEPLKCRKPRGPNQSSTNPVHPSVPGNRVWGRYNGLEGKTRGPSRWWMVSTAMSSHTGAQGKREKKIQPYWPCLYVTFWNVIHLGIFTLIFLFKRIAKKKRIALKYFLSWLLNLLAPVQMDWTECESLPGSLTLLLTSQIPACVTPLFLRQEEARVLISANGEEVILQETKCFLEEEMDTMHQSLTHIPYKRVPVGRAGDPWCEKKTF